MSMQFLHELHGFSVTPFSQLIPLENIRAIVVFPVPLAPENKYALCILFFFREFFKAIKI